MVGAHPRRVYIRRCAVCDAREGVGNSIIKETGKNAVLPRGRWASGYRRRGGGGEGGQKENQYQQGRKTFRVDSGAAAAVFRAAARIIICHPSTGGRPAAVARPLAIFYDFRFRAWRGNAFRSNNADGTTLYLRGAYDVLSDAVSLGLHTLFHKTPFYLGG